MYKAKAPDRIFAQRVKPSTPTAQQPARLVPSGPAVELISANLKWETGCVEAPWVVTGVPGQPWLFLFFAGDWDKRQHPPDHKAIGVARSRRITGPWEVRPSPILHASPNRTGAEGLRVSPGHCSVVPTDASRRSWAIVYHSSLLPHGSATAGPREMMMDALTWGSDGWPRVGTGLPSQTPQPVPGSQPRFKGDDVSGSMTPPPHKVAIEAGHFTVDGKPFFPLGFYYLWESIGTRFPPRTNTTTNASRWNGGCGAACDNADAWWRWYEDAGFNTFVKGWMGSAFREGYVSAETVGLGR